jgi:hypothetical protein
VACDVAAPHQLQHTTLGWKILGEFWLELYGYRTLKFHLLACEHQEIALQIKKIYFPPKMLLDQVV